MLKAGNKSFMDTADEKQIDLHFDILPRATKKALDFLSKRTWLKNSKWYLAGGTALALQANHRRSVDLDFFSQAKNFDNNDFLRQLADIKEWRLTLNRKNTIYGELFNAKASFIAYPFFVPQDQLKHYGFIRILSPQDIAVMKIIAISQRGRKRDFFDLYWCAKNVEPLENIIKRLKKQYPTIAHDYHHLLKSLVYFNDAESDPAPTIYFNATWRKVKKFFIKEVPHITRELIG